MAPRGPRAQNFLSRHYPTPDPTVELRQLKQSAEPVGPLTLAATVIAERIEWRYSIRTLSARVASLRLSSAVTQLAAIKVWKKLY
jgi:hypothetical protein